MAKKVWSILNRLMGLAFLLLFLGYFGTSVAALVINSYQLKWWGILLNVLVLIFEMIGPFYVIYFMVQLIDGILQVNKVDYDLEKLTEYPKVVVTIPVRNAHPQILKQTLQGFLKQTYPNFDIWVGDDHSDEKYASAYKKISKELKVNYFYGDERSFKAGILNKVIDQADAKYIAIFDVDQIPMPKILDKFVAILEQNPQYAFVQAKFDFREVKNLLHTWEMISYYQLACSQSGKMRINNVLFHGCNACFRREYSYPLPEGKLSEDYDHTINLLKEGHYGCWLEEIGVTTLATDTFDHKISQMYRWTTGQIGAVMDHWKDFFKSKLKLKQKIDLFISSTLTLVLSSLYLVGIIYAIIYALKVPIFRALYLDDIAMLIVPLLIFGVYCIMITATSIYSIKNSTYKLNFFQILLYLLFSSFVAPILFIPTVRGLLRMNKITPGKTQWNRKIKLYLVSSILTLFGLVYCGLSVISILDNFDIVNWYPGENFFYSMFLLVAFMLTFSLPFTIFAKLKYKKTEYSQDENVYI